jgi:hypothetical protein
MKAALHVVPGTRKDQDSAISEDCRRLLIGLDDLWREIRVIEPAYSDLLRRVVDMRVTHECIDETMEPITEWLCDAEQKIDALHQQAVALALQIARRRS